MLFCAGRCREDSLTTSGPVSRCFACDAVGHAAQVDPGYEVESSYVHAPQVFREHEARVWRQQD